jgi:hypothetical protein
MRAQANQRQDVEPIMKTLIVDQSGLVVHDNGMIPHVSPLNPNFNISSFDSDNFLVPVSLHSDGNINDEGESLKSGDSCSDDAMGISFGQMNGENLVAVSQNKMRNASFGKEDGELFESPSSNSIPTSYFSVVENDSVSFCPSIEEVIAFGGIPKPNMDARSSSRLGGQPNADMPQMEKAMKMAQMRDDFSTSGKLNFPIHSIINIPDSEIARKADRLGISLGNSVGEIDNSVKGIKMVEEQRILTILEKKRMTLRI